MAKIKFEDPKVVARCEELRSDWRTARSNDNVFLQRQLTALVQEMRDWTWDQAIEWMAED